MRVVAKNIDVIASFVEEKQPLPIKFRFKESDTNKVINVDKVICVEKERLAGIEAYVYRCQSVIGEYEKIYELKYNINECRWLLYKI